MAKSRWFYLMVLLKIKPSKACFRALTHAVPMFKKGVVPQGTPKRYGQVAEWLKALPC